MATIPSGTKFLGVDPAFTDLTERKGTKVDRKSEYFTIADIAEEIGPGPTGPQGVEGPVGPQGALGPVGPAGLEWRGAWVSGTSYVADDAVGYGGASYFCISATSGTTTPNLDTTKWALLAAQGAQGQTGATGAQGPQGPAGPSGSVTYTEESVTTESMSIAQDTDGIGFDLGKITKNFTRAFVSSPTNNYLGLSNVGKIVGDFFVVRNQSTTTSINVLMLNNARLLGTNGFETVQTFEIKPNTYARFTLVNTTGGSDKVFMVEVINPLGVATKTKGLVYGDSESYFTQTVLPYDINTVLDGAESSSFKLPNTTVIGKEVIVDVMGNNCRFYGFNGGLAFETAVNGSGSQIIAVFNDLIKFTSLGGNFWLVEYLPRVYPTLNGKNLVTQNAVYTFTTSNTTSALSLSALNASYPNSSTIYDFKVFCPNITGGGLVYIKTGVSTWVSQSITAVS